MAALHSRYIAGNLVFWDTHRKRLVDAIGPDVVKYFNDFTEMSISSDAIPGWTTTLVETGGGESTLTHTDAIAGIARLTTDATEDDGITITQDGEKWELTSGQSALYFGALFQASEATEIDWFIGLSTTTTTALAGVDTAVYFDKLDGATDITGHTELDTTASDTASTATFAASTDTLVEFFYDGLAATPGVEFFVNGTSLGSLTTNLPDDEFMKIVIEVLTGSGAARTLDLDWVRVIQIGR